MERFFLAICFFKTLEVMDDGNNEHIFNTFCNDLHLVSFQLNLNSIQGTCNVVQMEFKFHKVISLSLGGCNNMEPNLNNYYLKILHIIKYFYVVNNNKIGILEIFMSPSLIPFETSQALCSKY
jgi:hypothetical protein